MPSDSSFSMAHSINPSEGERPRSKGTSGFSRAERISSRVFLPETTPETALAILRTWFQRNAWDFTEIPITLPLEDIQGAHSSTVLTGFFPSSNLHRLVKS